MPALTGGEGFAAGILVMKFSRGAGGVDFVQDLKEGAPEGPPGGAGGVAAAAVTEVSSEPG